MEWPLHDLKRKTRVVAGVSKNVPGGKAQMTLQTVYYNILAARERGEGMLKFYDP